MWSVFVNTRNEITLINDILLLRKQLFSFLDVVLLHLLRWDPAVVNKVKSWRPLFKKPATKPIDRK